MQGLGFGGQGLGRPGDIEVLQRFSHPVSLSLRLKDLLGPVTREKKKKRFSHVLQQMRITTDAERTKQRRKLTMLVLQLSTFGIHCCLGSIFALRRSTLDFCLGGQRSRKWFDSLNCPLLVNYPLLALLDPFRVAYRCNPRSTGVPRS